MTQSIIVYGSGLMGRGIAQVAASFGNTVTLVDVNEKSLEKAQIEISKSLERVAVKRCSNQEQAQNFILKTTQCINYTTNPEKELGQSDFIIEAIFEDLKTKQDLFSQIEEKLKPGTVMVSNTSSISILEIGKHLKKKNLFAGLHFFNPVPIMKLVEVIATKETDGAVIEKLKQFVISLDKIPVVCKDTPGFIVNKLLIPYLIQAVQLYESGTASKEDIDTAVKLGLGYPMGPFELLDYVGLDTTKDIVNSWNDPSIRLPKVLDELVRERKLGVKTGHGFYDYPKSK